MKSLEKKGLLMAFIKMNFDIFVASKGIELHRGKVLGYVLVHFEDIRILIAKYFQVNQILSIVQCTQS